MRDEELRARSLDGDGLCVAWFAAWQLDREQPRLTGLPRELREAHEARQQGAAVRLRQLAADYERAYRRETGQGLVPPTALKDTGTVDVREPAPRDRPRTAAERTREAMDTLWKVGQYAFLACACGAKLKVPPGLALEHVACPHCGARHDVKKPGGSGAPA